MTQFFHCFFHIAIVADEIAHSSAGRVVFHRCLAGAFRTINEKKMCINKQA